MFLGAFFSTMAILFKAQAVFASNFGPVPDLIGVETSVEVSAGPRTAVSEMSSHDIPFEGGTIDQSHGERFF